MRLKSHIKLFIELGKVKIALLAALSAFAGFVVAANGLSAGAVFAVSGIFLMACGALALNQYQERHSDALMDRTKSRPLPSGRTRPFIVLSFAVTCIAAGFLVLLLASPQEGPALSVLRFRSVLPAVTGLIAVIWYNIVYLLLKRKNAFASIPGSLAGALPLLAGFLAGGGHLTDPRVLVLVVFMIVWQVPHFWMIAMRYGRDYEKAGIPSLTGIFTPAQMSRMVFVWGIAAALISLMLPLYGVISFPAAWLVLLLSSLVLFWIMTRLLVSRSGKVPGRADLAAINIYAVAIMLVTILDRILHTLHG